ncbi:DNA-directed RNA polymerase subunit beta' [Borrelia sp. A-FGy1]|uniref:DNA-directed RNA polymerase subunit beta' n=1 Tax=Borrelia sp. A-FGy1 TaxID=2608247 RepID=UPI0015F5E8A0|nr:DNA-directed RNA polymerase subunit beta' [Borrelia sp. A-FGy1]QMU99170.1 DNA-directed RNA polymerase subunit beta' [Borrelia sp. A-FGy1]
MKEIKDFEKIKIKIASPDQIRNWSYGEVKKSETINYRTLRPEKDGLFCERIFGTTKEWECYCGKFKSVRYKGIICDRCNVEVTHFKVRRERMGHIELSAPVAHIWYYKYIPSRIGLLLDITASNLNSILYYEKYIVIEPGDTDLKKMQLLNEDEYSEARERYGMSFNASMGAEAIKTLLENLDLDELSSKLRVQMIDKDDKTDKKLLRRLEIIENFKISGNKPEWMIMDVLPVIPPEIRPMVQLDGGRFATSDLNDLYRRVINRNNRLRKLLLLNAPEIIVRNEKRMLQESVDSLFDNSHKRKVVKGSSNRPLKSLSDALKGKQGRFRQNLLGKRVDYSGRSVIVVGPELKLHQCGIPSKMALELFKPFVIRRLIESESVFNIKRAKSLIEQEVDEVWQILDDVIKEHPVLLNRAPTLHRLGIQAFEPVLVEGKAIKLHPLVCHAYNADFDGDQMAVHVPLTPAAQAESWALMLSTNNLLNPANGHPIVFPSQDIVLGLYYLTMQKKGVVGEGRKFLNFNHVLLAVNNKSLDYNAKIYVKVNGDYIETTSGRVVFNEALPDNVEFVNKTLSDYELQALISDVYVVHGSSIVIEMLDIIKELGFKYATKFGCTISMSDIIVPQEKKIYVEKANREIAKIQNDYTKGVITGEERYNNVISVWSKTNEELTTKMMEILKSDRNGFNVIYMMADSGARGSRNQIRQLAGMRGLMAKTSGDIIELPIISNFKEGLSVIEFFISTNGARKGLADTALKTADAGYLTRRLVDIAQDVVVRIEDCGTINGIKVEALKNGEEVVESLREKVVGSYSIERIKHPITGEIILDVNEEITEYKIKLLETIGINKLVIRSVLTCEAEHGVCQKCYGRDFSNNKPVNIGEAVGIIAAQSIGQPGTQLTMRTFHIGGVAQAGSEDDKISLKNTFILNGIEGFNVNVDVGLLFTRKGILKVINVIYEEDIRLIKEIKVLDGQKVIKGMLLFVDKEDKEVLSSYIGFIKIMEDKFMIVSEEQEVPLKAGTRLEINVGDYVKAGSVIGTFDPFAEPIIAEVRGRVKFKDIILGTTLKEEINLETGNIEKRITDQVFESLDPRILIINDKGVEISSYVLPGDAYLQVEDGQDINIGDIIAKLSKGSEKTQDITGGLPRVNDLFETRIPKNLTEMAKVSGVVQFKAIQKGKRLINILDEYGVEHKHYIPAGKHLLVRDGDIVKAGDMLCDGRINPHDVLEILGGISLQEFLLAEIQDVYRKQGVSINDKHIGVIIKQMMKKVKIVSVGDTNFVYNQKVDKHTFYEQNKRVIEQGGEPAVASPILIGITKASLNIDSFISAASFQETTKVLTDASIAGRVDDLKGLKENVVIGHLIPTGTGMNLYKRVEIKENTNVDV